MPSPDDPLLVSTLARAFGWSTDDIFALPDYLRVFCFEFLNYGGPEDVR